MSSALEGTRLLAGNNKAEGHFLSSNTKLVTLKVGINRLQLRFSKARCRCMDSSLMELELVDINHPLRYIQLKCHLQVELLIWAP